MIKCERCSGKGRVWELGADMLCSPCKGTGESFDITQYEWSDEDIEGCVINNEVVDIVELEIHYCRNMRIEKLDAIALAKHFKLTAEDLS